MHMITGYFLVIGSILLLGIMYLLKPKPLYRDIFLLGAFAIVLFLATCRAPYFVTDDYAYLQIFTGIQKCYFEAGLCFLNNLIRHLGLSTYIYFGILDGCIFTVIWLFIRRYSCNVVLSVSAFICLMYAFNAVNILRQFLALAVVLCGFKFVIQRRFWIFLCFIGVAYLFHHSAIICLLLYWLYPMKASARNVFLLFIGSAILFLLFSHIAEAYNKIGGQYAHYIVDTAQHNRLSNIIRLLVNGSIMCVSLITIKYTSLSKLLQSKLNMQFLTLCSCIATAAACISLQADRAERVAYYFYIFNIILIPQLLHVISNKSFRALLSICVFICMMAYGAIVLWSWQNKGIIYTFMWN